MQKSDVIKDSPSSLARSWTHFISGTLLSRLSGLARDVSMAYCFGTSDIVACFLMAFRFAHFFRRIFGEGLLVNSFIPHFESYRSHHPKQAAAFFRDVFFSIATLLIALTLVIELGLFTWLKIGTMGDTRCLLLMMIMLPQVIFTCFYGLCGGFLQCEGKFFLNAVSPIIFNLTWIVAIWTFSQLEPLSAMIAISISITVGSLFQWLMTFPTVMSSWLKNMHWKEFFQFQLLSLETKKMLSSLSIGILGLATTQINGLIDTLFARWASLEGPAYLSYAQRLHQLPLALFGIGISSALLPPLSRAMKAGNLLKFRHLLQFAIKTVSALFLPMTLAILILGKPSVNLIYGHGSFTLESVLQTTYCLWGYGIGLLPMGLSILIIPAFYSKKDYFTPFIISLISIGVNITLNTLFISFFQWETASIAFSTSISAAVNLLLLLRQMAKKMGINPFNQISFSFLKILAVSLIASGLTLAFKNGEKEQVRDLLQQVLYFLRLAGVFGSSFLLFAYLFRLELSQIHTMSQTIEPKEI